MLKLGLVIAAAFVLQIVLSSIQMRHVTKEFTAMRRRGRVACGRQAGGFHAGAIVLFLLDGAGVIQEGKMLMGVTCFARVRPLPGFTGKQIASLTEADLPRHGKNLRRAILDARNTYNKFIAGEAIPEPQSPFRRVSCALTGSGK